MQAMLALLALLKVLPALALSQYTLTSSTKFSGNFGGDIVGSSFVDVDGQFRFIRSAATYASTDTGSFTDTIASDDFGTLSANPNGVVRTHYDGYWNLPGSMCYQLPRRAVDPVPSRYEDDHCDVTGVWIQPGTNDWYGTVNDEYQFVPLDEGKTLTQNARIATGLHNNRILLAKSSDKGKTWSTVDALITDYYQPDQVITYPLFPNSTYSWGLSGARTYVDHVGGYLYGFYNHQIRTKAGATILHLSNLARARLTEAGNPSAWKKYYNGQWDQPAKGGRDGFSGEKLGFELQYDPKSNGISFTGTGADGKAVNFKYTPVHASSWSFKDLQGVLYTVDTNKHVITRDGTVVDHVGYHDPALDRDVLVTSWTNSVGVNFTDTYGVQWTLNPSSIGGVFLDTTTQRLYGPGDQLKETALSYNTYTGKYRAVGYDNYVYENEDIGKPRNWVPVGKNPASVLPHLAYSSFLDTGSLTNQNVGSLTYSIISDLHVSRDTVTVASGSLAFQRAVDASNAAIDPTKSYALSIGGTPLKLSNASTWQFEDVKDADAGNLPTGFYRLKDVATGTYLQTTGTTQAKRALGAKAVLGAAQPHFDPKGNNGQGSPGGSDQWYLLPYTSESSGDVRNRQGYRLVNRNSAFVLAPDASGFSLAVIDWAKRTSHAIQISRV